jgi:PAS domain S-box-containing protein
MAVLDADRVLLAVNASMTDTLGYAADQMIGRRADVFLSPDDWSRADAEWSHVLRGDRTIHVREVVRADGRRVRVQGAAIRDVVSGRLLVLFVAIDARLRPVTSAGDAGSPRARLTPRELEIVSEIAMGKRAHEIAADLAIAPSTVHTHVRNAMRKAGARSQAQLVAMAFARGLLGTSSL